MKGENALREIPKALQDDSFRFIKVGPRSKRPLERDWTGKANYRYDDPILLRHIGCGGNVGILCGFGSIVVVDVDDSALVEKIGSALPPTLSVLTGNRGQHRFYNCKGFGAKTILYDPRSGAHQGEIQSGLMSRPEKRTQVVIPPSVHPNGRAYVVMDDQPIAQITAKDLRETLLGCGLVFEKPGDHQLEKREGHQPTKTQKPPRALGAILDMRSVVEETGFSPGGADGKINCPFHPDKTASFQIYEDHGFCFGCGWHGNPYKFIADMEGVSYGEVWRRYNGAPVTEKKGVSTPREKGEKAEDEEKATIEADVKEFFRDEHGTPFVTIGVGGHLENWGVRSRAFRNYLTRLLYEYHGRKAPPEQKVNAYLATFSARCQFEGVEKKVFLRAGVVEGEVYVDLCNSCWGVVKISPDGVRVLKESPVVFQRLPHMKELIFDGDAEVEDVDLIFKYLELDEGEKVLFRSYLPVLFLENLPRPILSLSGDHGSGKSMGMRLVRACVDPSALQTLSKANGVGELVQQLSHHFFSPFDNLSSLRKSESDLFCRACTGEGFSKRELYSDQEDIIFSFRRAVAANGINLPSEEADFLDRSISIRLGRIPKELRRTESEIYHDFQRDQPKITGACFKILSRVLGTVKDVRAGITALPRMADFSLFGEAVAQAYGERPGVFLHHYFQKINLLNEDVLEAHPVGLALLSFMAGRDRWEGSSSELLDSLNQEAESLKINTRRSKTWPGAPNALSRRINEVKSNLIDSSIHVYHKRIKGRRIILLENKKNIVTIDTIVINGVNPCGSKASGGDGIFSNIVTKSSNIVTLEEVEGHQGDDNDDIVTIRKSHIVTPGLQVGTEEKGGGDDNDGIFSKVSNKNTHIVNQRSEYFQEEKVKIIEETVKELSEKNSSSWVKERDIVCECHQRYGMEGLDTLSFLEMLREKKLLMYDERLKAYTFFTGAP